MTLRQYSASAGAAAGWAEPIRRFDRWARDYEHSQLPKVLPEPVHDAVLRYARRHSPHPGTILDVGCGTGRLVARLGSAYGQAHVVGVDASTGMIREAIMAPDRQAPASPPPPPANCLSVTRYSIWSWPRCQCPIGATKRRAWPRSAAS